MKSNKKINIITIFIIIFGLLGLFYSNRVIIDYGHSSLYTKEDMKLAIEVIKKEFKTLRGFKLYSISYIDDEYSNQQLHYCNSVNNNYNFNECIVFESNFHSSKMSEAFEPDTDYIGWRWILARNNNSQWQLITSGYV